LLAYSRGEPADDLFGLAEALRRDEAMWQSIQEVSAALKTLRKPDPWSPDAKVTDDFLDPLFEKYFEKLNLPNLLHKTAYHVLARLVAKEDVDPEVGEKLDAIVQVARKARPRKD
jgi:hypothetical protein